MSAADPQGLEAPDQLEQLKKENQRLSRQIKRLRETLERNKLVALAANNLEALRSAEQQKREKYMNLLLENSPDIIILLTKRAALFTAPRPFWKRRG